MSSKTPRAPRFQVRGLNVVYDDGEGYWAGNVVDMSESGLFLETHHELPVGSKVVLIPDTQDGEELPFEIQAVVVRRNEYDLDEHFDRTPGLAFRISGLSVDDFAQLRAFLKAKGVPVQVG